MRYLRGINPLLGLVLALAMAGVSRGAVMASVPPSQHSVASNPEGVLSLSATDYQWHAEARVTDSPATAHAGVAGPNYLSAFSDATAQAADANDIVRHR